MRNSLPRRITRVDMLSYSSVSIRALHSKAMWVSNPPSRCSLTNFDIMKALMTSPPDPSLPKPPFCMKLNWGTSPAFTLRWLATTAVHFRHVGHLKNPLNLDDRGQPMAVLVGKDGQEIAPEAGMGVVWILDEEDEGRQQARPASNGLPPKGR